MQEVNAIKDPGYQLVDVGVKINQTNTKGKRTILIPEVYETNNQFIANK